MNKETSRVKNSIKNMGTTTIVYVITMLMSFIVRAVLSRKLGQDYVGLNGVLTSVVSSLSIADLGIDSVFVFLLYEPIAKNRKKTIRALMRLFRKIYLFIGIVFIVIGMLLIPFLKYIIGVQAIQIPQVIGIYVIFILNTGVSYFFAYYRVILNADQKFYIIARITLIVTIFTSFLQIIFLSTLKSFLMYALLLLLCTVVTNVLVGYISIKKYPITRRLGSADLVEEKVDIDTIRVLVKNTIGGISNKLGSIVVFSSDNILLANFTKLKYVGMYSNYLLITNGISSLLIKVIASITASVGSLGTEKSQEKNFDIFCKITFAVNLMVVTILLPTMVGLSTFIKVWVGASYVLPTTSVLLIVINLGLQIVRLPALTFIDAFGLQWIQRWKAVVEALVNIICSLLLLIFLRIGMNGVLIGTLISNLLVVNWYEPYLVLKHTGNAHYREYMAQNIPFIIIYIIQIIIAKKFLDMHMMGRSLWLDVTFEIVIVTLEFCLLYIIFRHDARMKYFVQIFKR